MNKKGYAVCMFIVHTDQVGMDTWNKFNGDGVIIEHNQAVLHDNLEDATEEYNNVLRESEGA